MKLILLAVLSNAVRGALQDIGANEGNCNTCMAGAQPDERATFNPICINDRGGRGCVPTNRPQLGSQFNGCQFCGFGDYSDIPCGNQFCDSSTPVFSQTLLGSYPKLAQTVQSYTDLYTQSPALAQQKLQQWKVTHPELVQMFQTYAQTWKLNPEQARIQLLQWKATRPELFQMLVSQNAILDNSLLVDNSLMVDNSFLTAHPKLSRVLQSYVDLYTQNPSLTQHKLQQWKVTHPELVQVFQTYAKTWNINPQQAREQLEGFKTTRPDLFQRLLELADSADPSSLNADWFRRRLHMDIHFYPGGHYHPPHGHIPGFYGHYHIHPGGGGPFGYHPYGFS